MAHQVSRLPEKGGLIPSSATLCSPLRFACKIHFFLYFFILQWGNVWFKRSKFLWLTKYVHSYSFGWSSPFPLRQKGVNETVTYIKPWPMQTRRALIFVVGSFRLNSVLSKGSILRDPGVTSLIIMRGRGHYQEARGPLIYATVLRLPNSWTPSRKSVTSRNFSIAIGNTISHPCFRIRENHIFN